ncbi:MAG: hypothetical protein N2376_10920 [Clostridia bacterium]|nr:hypothetical protein [Clostridia bacterium]
MAFWDNLFSKKSRDAPREGIPTGRQTQIGDGYSYSISPYSSRTGDVLKTLRGISEDSEAVEFLKKVNPDVSMAVWNFVRLANQGNQMEFYSIGKNEQRLTGLESEWRDFAARVNEISNSGLDGLIDQLHYSSFLLGAMGIECEVNDDRTDIYDIYPVKPQTIHWELLEVNGRKKWVPYQYSFLKKVYLDKAHANFFWVPADPEIGDPRGTLTLTPVLQAIDFQMQILQDLQAVLHHQGWPRDDYEINLERMLTYCPQHIKNNAVELDKWLKAQYNNISSMLRNMKPDSDIIHFDDIKRNQGQGGANQGRSIDVRAVNELVDVQTLSGLKQMAIFMNRNQGVTESWGTVQFRIFCSGIASCQRGSKRLIEEIARLWLRVKGVQAKPVFKHNTIDWNSEEQRMTVKLLEQKFHAIAVMMKWESNDQAAQAVMKAEKALGNPAVDSIKISFGTGDGINHGGAAKDSKPSSEQESKVMT